MWNRNHAYVLVIGGIGAALLLSGCPKKVDTAKSTATVQEEKVAPPAEPVKPEPAPSPKVEETPVAREAEMPAEKGLGDAFFDYDKYTIRDDARAELEKNAGWLKSNPKARVKIEGYCDERGTNEYNLALGERRARAVKRFLVSLGVDGGRLSIISYGEEHPVCMEHNEVCYSKNRRAHFTVQ
ncbi:MAG: peptidoglycan-associated lipoprotein Pal [Nitrospirae bacterium]|nr:peptidoglycan-associated lipoprotein Pal [Nitrospirota bacterium]